MGASIEVKPEKQSILDQLGDVTIADLEALTDDHGRVLAAFLGRQSYNEIAAAQNLPLGTVRSRLNRARLQVIANRAKGVRP